MTRTRQAYLGIDLGGTGAKAGVFDGRGGLLGLAHGGYAPKCPEEGYAEIPIEVIYRVARDAARKAISTGGARIRALSISSQGQTFVSLDGRGRPLHPAILWYDSRAAAQADRLSRAIAASPLSGTAARRRSDRQRAEDHVG